jgi:hypothetical protein
MDNGIIDSAGNQRWLDSENNTHRDGGPALIRPDGAAFWFQHGDLHREDGPAAIYASGKVRWVLNRHSYSFDEWLEKTPISDEQKVMLKLQYS